MKLASNLTRLMGLVDAVGLWGTLKLIQGHYHSPKGTLLSVSIKGIKHPVYLRAGSSDFHTFCQIFAFQEYDFEAFNNFPHGSLVREVYSRHIIESRRPRIVDAGANIGLATVWYANRFPLAEIVAVEPEARNYDLLRRNTDPYPNVRTVKAAVWGQDGSTVQIDTADIDAWAYQCKPGKDKASPKSEDVQTVSIPTLTVEAQALLIIKIDVEGAEESIFAADVSWMTATTLMVVELHDQIIPFRRVATPFYRAIAKIDCEICNNRENTFVFVAPPDKRKNAKSRVDPNQASLEEVDA